MGQNFHPSSSSVPQASQFTTVKFWPQCGQKVIVRPAGSSSLQYRHRSPALATTAREPIGEREVLTRGEGEADSGDGAGRGAAFGGG
ncbi:MAG TPA: hypothetical protein VNS10_18265, partial [Gemmatimonadaceae bacterium]|nr:hypothetical protein [Gemmatimonadaceae bacterium]